MVYDKVVKLIAENLDIEESAINADSVITDDLGADSLDVVDLCMAFEDEFGVEIPDDAVENIRTVGDIVKFIEDNQ
jgi:acyl carrier protein